MPHRDAEDVDRDVTPVPAAGEVSSAEHGAEPRPSVLETRLAATLPPGVPLPVPLCRAWSFMESQGWGGEDAKGRPFLTPYPGDAQLGPVFSAKLSIRGWLNPEAPGAERLIPLAETDGSGGFAAIWMDNAGQPRFVSFSSEGGEAIRLADTPVDFLRLVAVGYDEFIEWNFGEPPNAFEESLDDEDDSVAAHSVFRAWVESEFDVSVPDRWSVEDDTELNAWIGPLVDEHGLGLD